MKKLKTNWHLNNGQVINNFFLKTSMLILKISMNDFSLNFIDEYDDDCYFPPLDGPPSPSRIGLKDREISLDLPKDL